MGAVWGAALITLVIILMGVAVLLGVALLRQNKESWKAQLRETSKVVLERPSAESFASIAEPRRISFDQMWAEESEQGIAYWDVVGEIAEVTELAAEMRTQHSKAGKRLSPRGHGRAASYVAADA